MGVDPSTRDPNSSNWAADPITNPGHKHTGSSLSLITPSATVTTPVFVSGVAQALSATADVMLYIDITTSASLAVTFGPTSGAEHSVYASGSAALGVISVRVPAAWLVLIAGTVADLAFLAVTC